MENKPKPKPKPEKVPTARKVVAGTGISLISGGILWQFYLHIISPLEARVRLVEKDVAVERSVTEGFQKRTEKDIGEIKSDVKELLKRSRREKK